MTRVLIGNSRCPERSDSQLVAALGTNWAHAVTTCLVLETKSGKMFIKVAKSPISPPLAFPFIVTSPWISLLDDCGMEMKGQEITAIHCHGSCTMICNISSTNSMLSCIIRTWIMNLLLSKPSRRIMLKKLGSNDRN